jgi:hypothetical protein
LFRSYQISCWGLRFDLHRIVPLRDIRSLNRGHGLCRKPFIIQTIL